MTITPKISRRMVEAKRRLRMARAKAPLKPELNRRTPKPRLSAAKWTFEIRDGEHGDRVRFRLYRAPWPNQWFWRVEHGPDALVSSAWVAKAIQVLLTHAA